MILDNYINPVRSDVTEIKVKTDDDTELALHIKPMSEADWQVAQAYFVSGVADLAGECAAVEFFQKLGCIGCCGHC